MHDVAVARRQRGNYGKQNMRQLPVFETSSSGIGVGDPSSQGSSDPQIPAGLIGSTWNIPPKVPAQGYEHARMEFNFDLLSLSTLTTVHFSRAAVKALSMAPDRIVYMLQLRETSFLDYVPAYYENCSVLRNVIDCTMAQARRVIAPDRTVSESVVLSLYVKALGELQAALNDPERWKLPEVLCAAQVLSLFEVCYLSDFNIVFTNTILALGFLVTPAMAASHCRCGQIDQGKRYPRLRIRIRKVFIHRPYRLYCKPQCHRI
jgi:hypothetical protein